MGDIAGLFYEEHGLPDAPPVVLSAGLGGSGTYWMPNLAALTETYRVILYDHRGTGRSDRSFTGPFPIAAWARDILFLMGGLDLERAHIVGHAAGGLVGLLLARLWPDRVDRLVLVNAWAEPDPHFMRCFEARLALLRMCGPEAYLKAQPIFLYPANWSSGHSAELDAELSRQLESFPGEDMLERRIEALRAFRLDDLGAIRAPTLVLAAADDVLVPSDCSERLAAGIKGSTLTMMKWGGHACNVTDPQTFNRHVLEFLGS